MKSEVISKQEPSKFNILYYEVQKNMDSLKRYWIGRMLTIADGCISDLEQRKAVKDLINTSFWNEKEYWSKYINDEFEKYAKTTGEDFNTSDKGLCFPVSDSLSENNPEN
jgi:hypothetical protein